ncbi:putative Zn(2)-C6 fungal-type domain-containing protein [Seiridium cardinale]|uniref:Zn(2)-C6 fungal-type domain-containing protein n=1 Tax=Seiridium cardinale TaxID=138064 RepID=A0ABR2XQ76_9PEZI
MPRALNTAGISDFPILQTSDETLPVCGQCARVGRYCDRSTDLFRFVLPSVNHQGSAETAPLSPPVSSRMCLEEPEVAAYFHHYITDLAQWYDLGDDSRRFALLTPEIALVEPLLLDAILALAAIHVSQSTGKAAARRTAELYHGNCVRSLIKLEENSILLRNGVALAATCLLRSYEILDGKSFALEFWPPPCSTEPEKQANQPALKRSRTHKDISEVLIP